MKIVWKKREDAVSPVIATILMVAITVVLAAVLYVMVIGFGTGGGSTPAGSWTTVEATSQTEAKLTFGAFTQDVQPMDIKLFLTYNATSIEIAWPSAPTGQQTPPLTVTPTGITATYFDYSWTGNLVNAGDYIKLANLPNGTSYTIEVFHIDSEATMAMTGDAGTFSTPL